MPARLTIKSALEEEWEERGRFHVAGFPGISVQTYIQGNEAKFMRLTVNVKQKRLPLSPL